MTREEALKIVRENYPHFGTTEPWLDLEKALATLIPELAESEDEKARKFLIQHISEWIGCIEHDLKISSKDIESEKELAMFKAGLAYLEKQKESPKSTDSIPPDCVSDVKYEDRWHNVPVTIIKETAKECLAQMKPAEWSKEDEEMLTELLLTIEPSNNYDEMRNWLLLKLKSLLLQGSKDSLQTHWKPSEEQKEALEYVIRDYREDGCNATANYLQEILDHLKNM